MVPNPSVNRTARKRGLQVPSGLLAPAGGYLQRWAANPRVAQTRDRI